MSYVFCSDADYPPFPETVDNSLISSYKACEQQCFRNYFQHLHPTERSVHLVAGGAYAKGLEVTRKHLWEHGMDLPAALAAGYSACIKEYSDFNPPAKSPKTLENILLAMDDYFRHYGTDTDPIQPYIAQDGKPAVEFTFAIPIPGVNHPITGNPILYTGRFDMLSLFMKALYILDDKTTSSLGPQWTNNWALRSQFIGYTWACETYNYPVAGAIIRGVALLTREVKHAQAVTHCPDFLIERWLASTQTYLLRMISSWQRKEWLYDYDSACTSYGGCPYLPLCDKSDPDRWIPGNFVVRKWNPLD